MNRVHLKIMIVLAFLAGFGCAPSIKGNDGHLPAYSFTAVEPEWIRNGEPIQFEKGHWCPQDEIDLLLDTEVLLLGQYRGVQFFVEKEDVRPYNRLYTKFGRNKFRAYKKETRRD